MSVPAETLWDSTISALGRRPWIKLLSYARSPSKVEAFNLTEQNLLGGWTAGRLSEQEFLAGFAGLKELQKSRCVVRVRSLQPTEMYLFLGQLKSSCNQNQDLSAGDSAILLAGLGPLLKHV